MVQPCVFYVNILSRKGRDIIAMEELHMPDFVAMIKQ